MVNYNIDVYLKHTEMENMYVRELIELVTNDINGNIFNFTIHEAENTYDLTGKSIHLIVKSENGTVIEDVCTIKDATQGKASITLPSDMFCEGGTYYAEVQIWKDISRITTLPFDYTVRLSLETDEAVKADNRFSLLQQALSDVANADNTATTALNKANEALGKTASFNQAVEEVNQLKDDLYPLHDEIKNKNQIDGVPQTSFNFIANEVVPDGLMVFEKTPKNVTVHMSSKLIQNQTIIVKTSKNINASPGSVFVTKEGLVSNKFFTYSDKFRIRANSSASYDFNMSEENTIIATFDNTTQKAIVLNNGVQVVDDIYSSTETSSITGYVINESNGYNVEYILMYDRVLTPEEIQHNFQVLNNSPSLISMNDYAFATDSNHVTMDNGYNIEEYATARMLESAKTFTSTGEAITIDNGQDKSKILSASIEGQTVKNYIYRKSSVFEHTQDGYVKIKTCLGHTVYLILILYLIM